MKKIAFIALGATLVATTAHAFTISTGFEAVGTESPGWDSTDASNEFATNNWTNGGNGNATPGFNARTIAQGSVVKTGNQSIKFLQASAVSTDYRIGPSLLASTTRYLRASVDVFVDTAGTGVGRGFGLQADTQGWRLYTLQTGVVRLFNAKTFTASTVGNVTAGAWNQLGLEIDQNAGLVTYTINGTSTTINQAFGAFDSVTGMAILSRDESGTNKGLAYFDNYTYSTDVVPEPVSLFVVGTGIAAFIARRKRNS